LLSTTPRRHVGSRPFTNVLRRGRWRHWLVGYLLAALAWPLAGPLPWLIENAVWGEGALALGVLGHHDGDEHAGASHHHDASDVPGSPTHPDDHNCFECQVLHYLGRCVLPDATPPSVPPALGDEVRPPPLEDAQQTAFIAPGPPIRGPPPSLPKAIRSIA
jgi:hypothetical protein